MGQGKCGACAPGQLPGGFPFCAAGDKQGVSPVCGADGVTYRNMLAAKAAAAAVSKTGSCTSRACSEENEACFVAPGGGAGQQSTCCEGFVCQADAAVQLEAHVAQKLLGGSPGLCKRSAAAFGA